MKLLLVRHTKKFIENMVPRMIPLGIELYTANSIDEIEKWLIEEDNNSLFFNIESGDDEWIDYIQQLKERLTEKKIKIAVYLPKNNYEFLRKLYKADITSFVYQSEIPDHIVTQMLSIIRYLEQEGERRGHVRLPLIEKDNSTVKFIYKEKEYLCPVTMISPVALSFTPSDETCFVEIEKKEILNNIEVNINGTIEHVDAIVARTDETIALMFINIQDRFINTLCSFIFSKLNEKK